MWGAEGGDGGGGAAGTIVAAAADARQQAPALPEAFALAACSMAEALARRIRPDLAIALAGAVAPLDPRSPGG